MIDLTDSRDNIRIYSELEKYTTYLWYMGHCRSRVMHQRDCNVPATIVYAINGIFRDMIFKDLIIYIDDIIISSVTYKEHLEAFRRGLLRLQDQECWLKQRKCQFFTKRFEILAHLLIPEGLSADLQKVRKLFDFLEPQEKRQLQGFIGLVKYLFKFLPHLPSVAARLTNLQGTTSIYRCADTDKEGFNQCKELINSG